MQAFALQDPAYSGGLGANSWSPLVFASVRKIQSYKRLRGVELDELVNLRGLGRPLNTLRIALGLTQRRLADRSGPVDLVVSTRVRIASLIEQRHH